jgi:hypothetical protein
MSTALNKLFNDLGDDGDRLRAATHAMENEANSNANARAFLAAIRWIAEQPRTPAEKIIAIAELVALPRGFVHIASLAEFCGWRPESKKPGQNA